MSSNDKKNATLGMPHGTATYRLRKIILFNLLKRHSENICVRCNKEIENVDDLSVEHIKPWEGVSADLFWDLNNIAFSHMKCNVPHRPGGGGVPKTGPEGTNWCFKHKQFLPIDNFNVNKSRWNGLHNLCKDHQHYFREEN